MLQAFRVPHFGFGGKVACRWCQGCQEMLEPKPRGGLSRAGAMEVAGPASEWPAAASNSRALARPCSAVGGSGRRFQSTDAPCPQSAGSQPAGGSTAADTAGMLAGLHLHAQQR